MPEISLFVDLYSLPPQTEPAFQFLPQIVAGQVSQVLAACTIYRGRAAVVHLPFAEAVAEQLPKLCRTKGVYQDTLQLADLLNRSLQNTVSSLCEYVASVVNKVATTPEVKAGVQEAVIEMLRARESLAADGDLIQFVDITGDGIQSYPQLSSDFVHGGLWVSREQPGRAIYWMLPPAADLSETRIETVKGTISSDGIVTTGPGTATEIQFTMGGDDMGVWLRCTANSVGLKNGVYRIKSATIL